MTTDYIVGTLLIPILVIGLTFLWLGLVLVLKCFGERVGWWSGQNELESNRYPYRVGVGFGGGGTASSSSTNSGSGGAGAPVGVRVIVLLASLGMILCACVSCASGVDGFYKSFGIIRDGIEVSFLFGTD